MTHFFIDRPIFSSVIAILITLLGVLGLIFLPIEQYPNITPPQILIQASYPGADAETMASTVAAPLEAQINGVENMIYMYSQSSASGAMKLSVFFDIGTDVDTAQINVQNRVNTAMPKLPDDVRRRGVVVSKQSSSILMIVALQSPDGRYDDIFTSNYASINIVDELARLKGVSQVSIPGARDYSMRLWLQPDRLTQYGLTAGDVVQAVKAQNQQFAVGQIGQSPTLEPVALTIPVTTKGRLSEPHEFDDIIIRAEDSGAIVQLKDVGRAELGAQTYDVIGALNGKPVTLIAIYPQYGANSLEIAEEIRKTMANLSRAFPAGIEYSIPYDTTKFVKASIHELGKTIVEAAILVVLVVLIFLQRLRSTLIPLLAMVISIVGTFAGMYALGYSLNTLTLFGLVLAIGTVVDDAIVVIENVERIRREYGFPIREAAKKAMSEVTGPIIAIDLVLCAVFIPVAFLGGIAGQLYQQFAVTISISVIISGIVALTLSPAMTVVLYQSEEQQSKESRFALWFNSFFDRFQNGYASKLRWFLDRSKIGFSAFILLIFLLSYLFYIVPQGFVPAEDQGYVMALAELPDGASLDRTHAVDQEMYKKIIETPGVANVISFSGYSLLEGMNKTNSGSTFITLNDWDERPVSQRADHMLWNLYLKFRTIKEALIYPFNPPSIQGMGSVGGFEFWIEDRTGKELSILEDTTQQLITKAKQRPELANLMTSIHTNSMQLYVDLDRHKAAALDVNINDIFQTLQILLGSLYINDFNKFGRVYQVVAQAEPASRSDIQAIGEVYVRSANGKMIPLKSLVTVRHSKGPSIVSRFNGSPAAKINGGAGVGYSSGQAMAAMEELAASTLPEGMLFSWAGQSYQEKKTGGSSSVVLLGGMVVVFLILAALYERWSLPFVIVLAAPFGFLGAIGSIWLVGLSNDVYFQVGLVTLISLAAKNAILIVEFAAQKRKEGLSPADAAVEASKLRLRAILMTSFTFIFGVIPLVIPTGAGAASRASVGVGVLGGMIVATIFGIFFVPLFFQWIEERTSKIRSKNEVTHAE